MRTPRPGNKPHPAEPKYESLENPYKIISRFFEAYGLESSQDRLWKMLRLTISSEEINEWNEIQRANCFHFYELLLELLDANYVLHVRVKKEGIL